MGLGDQYASKLRQSLEDIDSKSKELMDEATKSHIHEFHTCMLGFQSHAYLPEELTPDTFKIQKMHVNLASI